MSKQDSHFFNNFSLVLGILFAVTLGLFAFARHVGADQPGGQQVTTDPRYVASVEERLQPVARVAVAGQDNSALKIESTGPATAAAAVPKDGTAAYETACIRPATAPASPAPRRSATRPPGDRASRRARTLSTTTRCTASAARPA